MCFTGKDKTYRFIMLWLFHIRWVGRITYVNVKQRKMFWRHNLICGFFYMNFCLLVFPINAVVTVLWRRLWKRILHPLCSPVKREEKPQSLWPQSALGVRACGCMHSIKSCVPQPAVCAPRLTAGVPSKFLWSVCCTANRRVWHQNLLLDIDG